MESKKTSVISIVLLTVLAILFLTPFVIMIIGSMIKMKIPVGNPFTWIQKDLSFFNFKFILKNSEYLTWIKNSLIITIIPTALQMFFALVLGYIFSKKQFKGRDLIFWIMMAVIMVPSQILIIPRYIMFNKIGWINSYIPLILPRIWDIMGVFFVKQFMMQLPKELDEAAYIDGANDFHILFRIMMPLSKSVIATVGTFAFITCWNDFLTPLIFTTSKEMYPITVGLASLLTKEGNFGIEMAGAVFSFVPTFLMFLFFQKYFTRGIAFTGIK